MAAPKQTDPQYKLRMTPEIKEQIEKAAEENNRTMNGEILARLEESFYWPIRHQALQAENRYLDARLEDAKAIQERLEQTEKDLNEFKELIVVKDRRIRNLEKLITIQGEGLDKFLPLINFLEKFIDDYKNEYMPIANNIKKNDPK